MAENLYHLLSFLPATERWEMPRALETLAQQLVASGKLRINADLERNFVRYGDHTFTARELTDTAFKARTDALLKRHVAPSAGAQGLADLWVYLRNELKKARGVSAEKEIKVARILVQSAHPAVIQLLIANGSEIFVSYSHNVADLMPVHEWSNLGTSGGLQATDAESTAVYVSAGGDPFFEGEQKYYVTDGFPALARMVIIAGQELGHFADLRRSTHGIIGRYSTDINATQLRADPVARQAREFDRVMATKLREGYQRCGLALLRRAEKGIAFYHTRRRYSPPWIFYQLWRFFAWSWLMLKARSYSLPTRFRTLPYLRLGDAIEQYLNDMDYNLAPQADAYRHPDPLIEEAIAVIEAVARVPQQVHKWGDKAVQAAWPGLYQFYYATVIPGCVFALTQPMKPLTITILQRLMISLRRRFREKPGYYP